MVVRVVRAEAAASHQGTLARRRLRIELRGRAVPGNAPRGKFRWLPKRQVDALAALKVAATEAMGARPLFLGAVGIEVYEERAIPSSWSKKKQRAALDGTVFPVTTPDLKNIVWLCEDALSGIVFRDDAQVCEHHTRKTYGEQPGLVIIVTEL